MKDSLEKAGLLLLITSQYLYLRRSSTAKLEFRLKLLVLEVVEEFVVTDSLTFRADEADPFLDGFREPEKTLSSFSHLTIPKWETE